MGVNGFDNVQVELVEYLRKPVNGKTIEMFPQQLRAVA